MEDTAVVSRDKRGGDWEQQDLRPQTKRESRSRLSTDSQSSVGAKPNQFYTARATRWYGVAFPGHPLF